MNTVGGFFSCCLLLLPLWCLYIVFLQEVKGVPQKTHMQLSQLAVEGHMPSNPKIWTLNNKVFLTIPKFIYEEANQALQMPGVGVKGSRPPASTHKDEPSDHCRRLRLAQLWHKTSSRDLFLILWKSDLNSRQNRFVKIKIAKKWPKWAILSWQRR